MTRTATAVPKRKIRIPSLVANFLAHQSAPATKPKPGPKQKPGRASASGKLPAIWHRNAPPAAHAPARATSTSSVEKPLLSFTWCGTTVSRYPSGYFARLTSGRTVMACTPLGLLKGLMGVKRRASR